MSNTTTISGNLTREPEIRYTKEGQATTQLGVAVNRRWQDRATGEWQEATSFFDVVCWRDLAENVALSLSKGMRVVVSGRIEQRSWESDDGEHRSKVEIVADEIGPSLRFATADVRRTLRSAQGERSPRGRATPRYPRSESASRAGSPAAPVARPGAHGTGMREGKPMTTTHDAPTTVPTAAHAPQGYEFRQWTRPRWSTIPRTPGDPIGDRESLAPSIGALGIRNPPGRVRESPENCSIESSASAPK